MLAIFEIKSAIIFKYLKATTKIQRTKTDEFGSLIFIVQKIFFRRKKFRTHVPLMGVKQNERKLRCVGESTVEWVSFNVYYGRRDTRYIQWCR